jgi:hypothetical protein
MPELDPLHRVRLIAEALNRIIGSFHAARCTHVLWIAQAQNGQVKKAVTYGIQITFAVMMLMLRKFKCLWQNHVQDLVPEDSIAAKTAQSILAEYSSRNLGPTVNQLFAHYAADEKDLPLSTDKVEQLISSNNWHTEEEFLEWSTPILSQLILIRDDLQRRYDVTLSEEEA